jgi:hypothetical protein
MLDQMIPLLVSDSKVALASQMERFSRTGAQRTTVREHRKRRKLLQLAGKVDFSVRHLRLLSFLALIVCSACVASALPITKAGYADGIDKEFGVQTMQAANQEKITIQGIRTTIGNAVDCPQVRTDDGQSVPVSYLAPSVAIGDRVEVTGFMAVTTSCKGKVLYAEEVRELTK